MSAQRRPDPRTQDRRIKRLRKIVVGAELDTLRNLVGVGVGADHDDRDISLVRIAGLAAPDRFRSLRAAAAEARLRFRWRTPWRASLAVRENTPHGRNQPIEF